MPTNYAPLWPFHALLDDLLLLLLLLPGLLSLSFNLLLLHLERRRGLRLQLLSPPLLRLLLPPLSFQLHLRLCRGCRDHHLLPLAHVHLHDGLDFSCLLTYRTTSVCDKTRPHFELF